MGRELQSIVEHIDSNNVKEVINQGNNLYEELNSNCKTRNSENSPLNLNDITKVEVERVYCTHHTNNRLIFN